LQTAFKKTGGPGKDLSFEAFDVDLDHVHRPVDSVIERDDVDENLSGNLTRIRTCGCGEEARYDIIGVPSERAADGASTDCFGPYLNTFADTMAAQVLTQKSSCPWIGFEGDHRPPDPNAQGCSHSEHADVRATVDEHSALGKKRLDEGESRTLDT
jgi:hypothetical protein